MKKYLLTGLLLFLPLLLTVLVIIFLVDLFTNPILPLVQMLLLHLQKIYSFAIPLNFSLLVARGVSLLLLSLFILVLGFVARVFFFRQVIATGQLLLAKIPFLKSIYRVSRDLIQALLTEKGKAFQRPIFIPFPDHPSYCLGFLSGEVPAECQEKIGHPVVPVFLPTAPHPISGFLLLAPLSEIRESSMTNEEAVKFLVSCGLLVPYPHRDQPL